MSGWECALCGDEIMSDVPRGHVENRWHGCSVCGWKCCYSCWWDRWQLGMDGVELDELSVTCGATVRITPAVFWKNGKRRYPEMVGIEFPDGHGTAVGMRGEWQI